MPVSTECAAALLSFRYPSLYVIIHKGLHHCECKGFWWEIYKDSCLLNMMVLFYIPPGLSYEWRITNVQQADLRECYLQRLKPPFQSCLIFNIKSNPKLFLFLLNFEIFCHFLHLYQNSQVVIGNPSPQRLLGFPTLFLSLFCIISIICTNIASPFQLCPMLQPVAKVLLKLINNSLRKYKGN